MTDAVSTRTLQRQRKAAGIASPPGAPASLDDAKRVLVVLDAPARAIAELAGSGNVSAGIRIALQAWSDRAK
jgi:hypothetical protein